MSQMPSLGTSGAPHPIQPGFRMPPASMAKTSPAANPARPQVTHAKPDAMRGLAQQAHQENAQAGLAPPQQVQQQAPAGNTPPNGQVASNPGAPLPATVPAVQMNGQYPHLNALGSPPKTANEQPDTLVDVQELRQRAKEAASTADSYNILGDNDSSSGNSNDSSGGNNSDSGSFGLSLTRFSAPAAQNVTWPSKLAGVAPTAPSGAPTMAQPGQGPAVMPAGSPQGVAQQAAAAPPQQQAPPQAASMPVDPTTGQPVGGDPSMQQIPGSPGAPIPGAPPQPVAPQPVNQGVAQSMNELMSDAQTPGMPGEDMQDQLMVTASDSRGIIADMLNHKSGFVEKTAALTPSQIDSYATHIATSLSKALRADAMDGLFEGSSNIKAGWQNNSGPRVSATGESNAVGFATKSDHYDTGSSAWDNTAQYLKKKPAGRDNLIGKTASLKQLVGTLTKMAAAKRLLTHPHIKQAVARVIASRLTIKQAVDLRAAAQRLGWSVPGAQQAPQINGAGVGQSFTAPTASGSPKAPQTASQSPGGAQKQPQLQA